MKIDILTFSSASNFGAVLQAFALQHYLNLLGHKVKHIHFTYKTKTKGTSNTTAKIHGVKIAEISKRLNDKIRRSRFTKFRHKYISYSKIYCQDNIPINIDACDAYIVGSDQVWNTELNGTNSAFYLDFVTKGKKIAYAASVGRSITVEDKNMIMEYCNGFDSISVRENTLKDFLVQECRIDSYVTVDPVFLIEKKQWRKIEKKVVTPSRYILCYLMENSLGIREATEYLAKKMDAEVIWINGGSVKIDDKNSFPGKELKRMGPQQFVYLVDHSTAVVTNSFHGAAFSMIFEKKLCLVEHSKRNERLIQLLEYIGAKTKIVPFNGHIEDIGHSIIEAANVKFEENIKYSKDFLQRSLSN